MFEVVDGFEQTNGDERLEAIGHEGHRPKEVENREGNPPAHCKPLEDSIAENSTIQETHLAIPQAFRLQSPGAPKLGGHRATPERSIRLPEMGRCGILGCAHPQMMAAQVLGVKVFIEHSAEQKPPQQALSRPLAMNQFVGRDDRKSRIAAHEHEDHRRVHRKESLLGKESNQAHEDQKVDPHQQVDEQVEGP